MWRTNRDRGRPRGPTPPTPPCVRVRTRRFGSVARLRADRWKSKRSEVTVRQPNVQRRTAAQTPSTMRRAYRLGGKVSADAASGQLPEAGPAQFPLLPEETANAATNPFVQFPKYAGRFAETEVATPSGQVSFQRADQLVYADPSRALSQLPDSILEASQRLGRHAPFDLHLPREGESKEFSRVWPRNRALRLIDLQLQLAGKEGLEARHHPLARAFAAYVDITVVGVPHEAQPSSLKFTIEIVKHQI